MQKGFAGITFLILVVLIIIFILSYIFIAKPYKVSGDQVIAPFKNGGIVLSEKVSYLFNKPIVGDRIIFRPQGLETDFIGIVNKVENQNNVTVYTITATDKGQPWIVSADKITGKIYFPFVNKEEITQTIKACTQEAKICPDGSSVGRTGANCEFPPCPATSPTLSQTPTNAGETNNWKTYKNSSIGIEFKYPSEDQIQENPWGKNSISVVIPYRPKGQIMDKQMTFSKEAIVPMGSVKKCGSKDDFIESGCYRPTEVGGIAGIEYKANRNIGDWIKIINIAEPKLQIIIDGDIIFRPNDGDVDKILSTFKFIN